MKYLLTAAAFAIGAAALNIPRQSCTFTITASGGVSGTVGQLPDGQNRINGSYAAATYSISNGQITDSNNSGCILTPPTSQFQCDAGASPTGGFSIGCNGVVSANGSTTFYACPATDTEYNIYTTPVENQPNCKVVMLTASSCYSCTSTMTQMMTATMTQEETMIATQTQMETMTQEETMTAIQTQMETMTQEETMTATQIQQETVTQEQTMIATQTQVETVTQEETMTATQTQMETITQEETMTATQTQVEIKTAEETMTATQTQTITEEETMTATQKETETETETQTQTAYITMMQTVAGPTVTETSVQTVQSSCAAPETSTVVSTVMSTIMSTVSSIETQTQTETETKTETETSTMTAPAVTITKTETEQASSSPIPSPISTTPAATSPSSTSCPTNLSSTYEYPHLIIPVSSSSPNTAYGTSYNGVINSTTSSIFNFDIPSNTTGTCSLIFLFPQQSELETSSFTFSGNGLVDFSQLTTVATESTTYATLGSVEKDLGQFTVTPGSQTLVATFACPAGETVSYEVSAVSGTAINYFQDYNPSPIGLYITSC